VGEAGTTLRWQLPVGQRDEPLRCWCRGWCPADGIRISSMHWAAPAFTLLPAGDRHRKMQERGKGFPCPSAGWLIGREVFLRSVDWMESCT